MTGWRFCGRFNPRRQTAVTDEYSWIDEEEAKRRYHDPSKELTIVPPVDLAMGIVPYYIVVTTAEYPEFVLVEQQLPGVPRMKTSFHNLRDGRLFCDRIIDYNWPPVEQIRRPGSIDWIRVATYTSKQDGTGTFSLYVKGSDHTIDAKRKDIPLDVLYYPFPNWGEWDLLANDPRIHNIDTTPKYD